MIAQLITATLFFLLVAFCEMIWPSRQCSFVDCAQPPARLHQPLRHNRASPNYRTISNFNWRHQGRVRTYKCSGAHICLLFEKSVVITSDGPGTDVCVSPYTGVADIGQMINF